ncbi:DUF3017 domain-containing protein [Streptomyces sp. NBC_00690]|uniref:DUF3017 domain-containing protein n=1 Tax=Streptomyces sp. NBC_00690 TaxID=2975808 RepID=UPI002E2B4BD9|nr:DUF3017 domain-containing protein [Streptomyces sp. NBC_00690]
MGVRTNDDPEAGGPAPHQAAGSPVGAGGRPAGQDAAARPEGATGPNGSGPDAAGGGRPSDNGVATPAGDAAQAREGDADSGPETTEPAQEPTAGQGKDRANGRARADSPEPDADATAPSVQTSRRPPTLTTDTARPEGGGRAAPGDAPAPARQWPLLAVLALTGAGLLIIGLDPFAEAFRIGAILVGVALITGAVLRRTLPSVGMLAVRSRFTDMVTYAVLGGAITLLALMAQPDPWLELPFLKDLVEFAVR